MAKQRIGMIGIGMMGHGIARNILAHGYDLSYLDHPGNQPSGDLDESGARRIADGAALVERSDVLILCVTGSAEVKKLLAGPDSLVGALRTGTVVVDCSTGIPAETREIAKGVAHAGCLYVDAAMTRTPREAEEGRLNLLIGSDDETLAAIEPLLTTFSESRFHAGPVGAGQTLKLLHNFVSLGSVTLLSEAAACAAENDISPEVFVDCLRRGGGHGAALDRVAPFILEGDSSALRFTVANALKDLTYYDMLAGEKGSARNVASGVLTALHWLSETGHEGAMLPEAAQAFRRSSGEAGRED